MTLSKKTEIENVLIDISKLLLKNLNFSRSLTDFEIIDNIPTEDESCLGAHIKNEFSNKSIIYIKKEMIDCNSEKEFILNTISKISHELFHLLVNETFEMALASEMLNEKMAIMLEEKSAYICEEMVKNSLLFYEDITKNIETLKKLVGEYNA